MESRDREARPASWTARVLAPLALIATTLLVILVAAGSVDDSDENDRQDRDETTASDLCEPSDPQAVEDGYYVLQSGEDLSVVADKTCIDIDELLELNPNLDPQQLPINACIDLVVDGCKALAGA